MNILKPTRFMRAKSRVRLSVATICLLAFIAPAASPAQNDTGGLNEWRSNGPQEAVWAIAINPVHPNIIYAGARSGVFKSTNAGASWKKTGLTHSTLALAIDYTDPNIIYAGIGTTGFPGNPSLFKSTDGGATWSDTGVIDWDINLLIMDPNSPMTLYAGSAFRDEEEGGIILWKTTDGGESWVDSRIFRVGLAGTLGLSTYGWAISSTDPQTIYAAGNLFSNAEIVPGLFKSADGGASWNGTGLNGTLATAVAIDPSNPDVLYAGIRGRDDHTFRDMLKSTDGGANWFKINEGLRHLRDSTFSYISSLVIDPLEPNILYAGTLGGDTRGHGVFRSTDGGANWSPFNTELTELHIHTLAIDPTGKRLYAATYQGVFDYQFATTCVEPLSAERESFESVGGTGSLNVSAASGCRWRAVSYADWISITSGDIKDGSGTVSYSVSPNRSGPPRVGTVGIAARFFTVTQAGVPLRISDVSVSGKKLLVMGEGFDSGAVILLNDKVYKTRNDQQDTETRLIGQKAGKKIRPGDRVQVRNPDGSLSEDFIFTGS
jgi:hypothetical protein